MISVSQRVGRLAEIRMAAPVVLDDLTTMLRDMGAIGSKTSARLVVCADLTAASLFPDALADRLARLFRPDNPRLERVALVVGGGATFFLQVERLLREGGAQSSPGSRPEPLPSREPPVRSGTRGSDPLLAKRAPTRRAFRSASEAMSWLDDVLTIDERARIRSFFDEPRASP